MFDAATITTTHGFCQLVLAGLGVAGRVGVGATLIEDASDTVDEVGRRPVPAPGAAAGASRRSTAGDRA